MRLRHRGDGAPVPAHVVVTQQAERRHLTRMVALAAIAVNDGGDLFVERNRLRAAGHDSGAEYEIALSGVEASLVNPPIQARGAEPL